MAAGSHPNSPFELITHKKGPEKGPEITTILAPRTIKA
jgi:hypothetical protein